MQPKVPPPWKFDQFTFTRLRRLAWSKCSSLSLVPNVTQDGDVLFIAQGAELPLVLRPLENGCYELVGAAYTHGYMHGEAWTEERLRDLQEIEVV